MRRSEKIRPEHLARPALVYVRQSTVDQVRHHQESRRRQYDLAAEARALGWQEVIVIDAGEPGVINFASLERLPSMQGQIVVLPRP